MNYNKEVNSVNINLNKTHDNDETCSKCHGYLDIVIELDELDLMPFTGSSKCIKCNHVQINPVRTLNSLVISVGSLKHVPNEDFIKRRNV